LRRKFLAAALLCAAILPFQAFANELAENTTAPQTKPERQPALTAINHSRIPTEIQINAAGQAPDSNTSRARKKMPSTRQSGDAECLRMKAPYRSGLWEITSVSSSSRMPQPITAKVTRCITERDAQNACGLNQLSGGRNRNCHIADMQIADGRANWIMTCDSPSFNGQGTGHTTFTADSYEGKFDMQASMQGVPMQMNTIFKAKRLGNCK
jgi:hypothetical protein